MVFNDTTTRNGLIQECERITGLGTAGISGVTEKLKDFTARLNQALDRFYAIALVNDKSWHFDDTNTYESDGTTERKLPIGKTNLVSGEQDYAFAEELLMVKRVFAKDSSGVYAELEEETTPNTLLVPSGNSGTPTKYRLIGKSILLDYIPNYNSSEGLKVEFSRNGSKFVYTDTTKVPGIPSLYHKWLAEVAAEPYLIEKQLPQRKDIAVSIATGENSIKTFLANRSPRQPRMIAKAESNK